MMRFKVDLNGTLEADDIGDALIRLGAYFIAIGNDEETDEESPLEAPTQVTITPIREHARGAEIGAERTGGA